MKSMFKLAGGKSVMPKMSWGTMTGFKKGDFGLSFKPKRRRRTSIKKILRNV